MGLSGGIDSSVVAVMCVDAFGADHVHGVLLPGPYSSDHSCDDALELAQNLGVATETVSICEPFQAFENVLAFACGGELSGLAAENTQARCRMVCLMALSNTYGWMLVNRNLIELVERGRAVGEASAVLNVDPALVARIAATTDAYAFKRALEPPFPQARFYD